MSYQKHLWFQTQDQEKKKKKGWERTEKLTALRNVNHHTGDDANQHVTQAEGSGEDYGAAGLSEARGVQPCLLCVQTLHWLLFVWIYTCIRTADMCLLLLTSSNNPAVRPAAASKGSGTNHS